MQNLIPSLSALSIRSAPYNRIIEHPPKILFLCTGNLCRSPMAEALTKQRAAMAGATLEISSAGFQTEAQSPPEESIRAMRKRGIDISGHRSRRVTERMLECADLVIGMTHAQVWNAALLEPSVVTRVYGFVEIVRLNRLIRRRKPGEAFDDWIHRLHAGRQHELTRVAPTQEVPDPYRRRARVHERVAHQLEQLVLEMADCAFDPTLPDHELRWRAGKLIWHP